MPVSPHLLRKLQETLGSDAAEDLVMMLEGMDANRGDIGELRHEMQLGFAHIDARFEKIGQQLGKACANRPASSSWPGRCYWPCWSGSTPNRRPPKSCDAPLRPPTRAAQRIPARTVTVPSSIAPGTYHRVVEIDRPNAVIETNEYNNFIVSGSTVQ